MLPMRHPEYAEMARRVRTLMTEAQRSALMQLIEDYTRANTATPEAARAALIREGIYTADGELMPEFGGPPVTEKQTR